MDQSKIGEKLRAARLELGWNQRQLAEALGLTPQAISKWERGCGLPDLSLAGEVSRLLGLRLEDLLCNEQAENKMDGGNMKKTRFYVCPDCGNILASSGPAAIACCGKNLEALEIQPMAEEHQLNMEEMDGQLYLHMEHPMSKEHFIRFVAFVSGDKLLLNRLYPEQGIDLHFPRAKQGILYICCSQHGLFRKIFSPSDLRAE